MALCWKDSRRARPSSRKTREKNDPARVRAEFTRLKGSLRSRRCKDGPVARATISSTRSTEGDSVRGGLPDGVGPEPLEESGLTRQRCKKNLVLQAPPGVGSRIWRRSRRQIVHMDVCLRKPPCRHVAGSQLFVEENHDRQPKAECGRNEPTHPSPAIHATNIKTIATMQAKPARRSILTAAALTISLSLFHSARRLTLTCISSNLT